MEARVHGHEAQPGPSVRVGDAVEALLDAARAGGQQAIGDRGVAHVDQEEVDERLRGADHVFLRRHELHHGLVQIGSQRAIGRFLHGGVPVKRLGHVVGEVAHVAAPAMAMVKEGDEGIDIGSAATAARDDLIGDDGDGVLGIVEGGIRLNDKGERQFGLLQKRVGGGHGVQGRADVLGGAIGVGRGVHTGLGEVSKREPRVFARDRGRRGRKKPKHVPRGVG